MDALYSATLFIAIAAVAVACLAALYALMRSGPQRRLANFVTLLAAVAALASVVVSIAVHFAFGHSEASPEPMSVAEFTAEHKAFWVVLGLLMVAMGTRHLLRRHQEAS